MNDQPAKITLDEDTRITIRNDGGTLTGEVWRQWPPDSGDWALFGEISGANGEILVMPRKEQ